MAYTPQEIKAWTDDYLQKNPGDNRGVFDAAKSAGVTGQEIDTARGYKPGDVDAYTTSQGWGLLSPSTQPSAGSVPSQGGGLLAPKNTPSISPTPQPSMTPQPSQPKITTTATPVNTGLRPDETVEGRLAGILSKDSPLKRLSETIGIQAGNRRGLADSSLSGGEAFKHLITTATPIAQQDAGAMQNQRQGILQGDIQGNLYGVQAGYSSQLSAQDAGQASQLSAQNAAQAGTLSAQEAEQTKGLEMIRQDAENTRADAENTIKVQLANMEVSTRDRESLVSQLSAAGENFVNRMTEIQRDPNVQTSAKAEIISQAKAEYQATVSLIASLFGGNVTWGDNGKAVYGPATPQDMAKSPSQEPSKVVSKTTPSVGAQTGLELDSKIKSGDIPPPSDISLISGVPDQNWLESNGVSREAYAEWIASRR